MALTYTPPGELASLCPAFSLPNTQGGTFTLNDIGSPKAFLIMFICNHCPYVKAVEDRLIKLSKELKQYEVPVVAISSNNADNYPEDSFEKMKEKNYPFPYLYDESQNVAKAFGAVCTPDFFVYDKNKKLAYRGRLDDSWKDPANVTKRELKQAVEMLLEGKEPNQQQYPSMGCSIKWKNS